MDKFTIIANGAENRRGKNQEVARKIADYLEKHRKVCVILPAGEKKEGQSYSYTDPERIPDGTVQKRCSAHRRLPSQSLPGELPDLSPHPFSLLFLFLLRTAV